MKTIAVINPKGGTGKTVTSVFLSHALQRLGKNCLLIDADGTGSSSRWGELVEEKDANWPVTYASMNSKSIHKHLPALSSQFDYAIIDAPPLEDELGVAASALRAADYAIIPFSPATMEYDRVLKAWDIIEDLDSLRPEPLRNSVLLNRTIPNASATEAIREALEKNGKHVLTTQIPRRELYNQAFGSPLVNLGAYFDLALELQKEGI